MAYANVGQPVPVTTAECVSVCAFVPCRKGHLAERNKQGTCMECRRLSAKRYRTTHPDKRREHNRRYLRDNPDKAAQFLATYAERRGELRRLAALPLPVIFDPFWIGEPEATDAEIMQNILTAFAGLKHAGILPEPGTYEPVTQEEVDAYLAASP